MVNQLEIDPNLFRGTNLQQQKILDRMTFLAQRDLENPSVKTAFTFSNTVSMIELFKHSDFLNKGSVDQLIQRTMVGPRVRNVFSVANQISAVRGGNRNRLLGVALLSLDKHIEYDGTTQTSLIEPLVQVRAFGVEMNREGKFNAEVLRELITNICIYAGNAAKELNPHYARFGSPTFQPTVTLEPCETHEPTNLSRKITEDIDGLLVHLLEIESTTADVGHSFGDKVSHFWDALQKLIHTHPDHAVAQHLGQWSDLDILDSRRLLMGGDKQQYGQMQRMASATRRVIASVKRGLTESCTQLYPASAGNALTVSPSSEDQVGAFSLKFENAKGPVGKVHFSPRDFKDTLPLVDFSDVAFHKEISDCVAATMHHISQGKWWRAQLIG